MNLLPLICLGLFLWFISTVFISAPGGGLPRFFKAVAFALAGYYGAAILFSLGGMGSIWDFFAVFASRPSELGGAGVLAFMVGLFIFVAAFLVNPDLPTGIADRVRRYATRGNRRLAQPPSSIARGRAMSGPRARNGSAR